MEIFYLNKVVTGIKRIFHKTFCYPLIKYDKKSQNLYWQIRRKSGLKAKPNDFQLKRAEIFYQNTLDFDKTLFDIGSGDGTQLIAIREICSSLNIIGSDTDKFACEMSKQNDINCHLISDEEQLFDLIKKLKLL